MGNVVSQLVVRLVDQVSAPAHKAAAGLKQIDNSLAAIRKGTLPLGSNLYRELEKVKASASQIAAVERSWSDLQRKLRDSPIYKADHYFRATQAWHNRTLADIRAMRREYEGVGKAAAGVAAVVAGSYALRRVAGAGIRAGANNQREDARDFLAGLSIADTMRLRAGAASMSGRYKSLDWASAHERLRDTAMSMGSVDKALDLSDTIGAGNTVLQSLKGPQAAIEESRKFFKALDTLGKNVDAGEVRSLYDGYIKALGVEGADMNLGDLFTLAKRSKSGGASLSNEFLMSIAPSLMQDMGPDRVGTAIGSMVSQIVGGRATRQSKEAQRQFGLRDAKGRVVGRDLLLSNPFTYTNEVLIPALKKRGVDVSNDGAVVAALAKLFSNQSVADLFGKMITQNPQYQRKSGQYRRGPGLDAANSLPGRDPYVAYEGLLAQLRNLGANLSEHLMGPATAGLNSLSEVINKLAKASEGAGSAVALVGAALGALTAAIAVGSTTLKSIMPGIFGTATAGVGGVAGTAGAVAAGGAAASVVATEIVKAHKEEFRAVAENPMLGALSGDTGLAAAIINAPEIAESIRQAAEEAARKKLDGRPNDFNFSDMARPAEAGAAGSESGAGFRSGLKSELEAAEQDVAASVQRMLDMLNFRASPTVTPKVNAPATAPGKQSSLDGISRRLAQRVNTKTIGNFTDNEYA